MPKTTKTIARNLCRARWGAKWYECHPLIKKARLQWAEGGAQHADSVRVTEKDGTSYTV